MFLDPVVGPAVFVIPLIGDGDGLDHGDAVGCEQTVQLTEKAPIVTMPHRFQHLDGDNLVESSLNTAVVAKANVDVILEPGPAHALPGQVELLPRNGDAGDPTTGLPHRLDGKTAPTAADLQKMVPRAQAHLGHDAPELAPLGVGQGLIGPLENGARVGHGLVQEGLEEVVGEIVVRPDVAPTAGQ